MHGRFQYQHCSAFIGASTCKDAWWLQSNYTHGPAAACTCSGHRNKGHPQCFNHERCGLLRAAVVPFWRGELCKRCTARLVWRQATMLHSHWRHAGIFLCLLMCFDALQSCKRMSCSAAFGMRHHMISALAQSILFEHVVLVEFSLEAHCLDGHLIT